MASTSISSWRPSSSSSSSSNSKWRYDVFLSFRGEDTRKTFADHLYSALDCGNIKTFRDDEELPRGEEISPQLLKAIEGSRIAVIVFSERYAQSRWCLDELVKIMECATEKGQKVFPIFYHVEPSEVRNQTGIYGEALKNHQTNADDERKKKKIEGWKAALRKAGNLSGFSLQDRYESEFIEEIVGEIRRLIPKLVHVGGKIVGIDENLKQLKLLIDAKSNEVSMVGIYGIGGIGKTTIAKVIYNGMLEQFKHHSFLENVKEKSKDDPGLLQLQEKLLSAILMGKTIKLNNVDEGVEKIKDKCNLEKVLIVLDDVDCPRQLNFLAGSSEWFGPGSIIIVTTRNKRCLNANKAYSSYEAKGLAVEKALELFSWHAFKQQHPRDNYVGLCNRVLHHAKDLPLALVVLGSSLFERDENNWESTLDRLKTIPLNGIQKVLRMSYDGVDDRCKKVFLDIACFFKNWEEKTVTRILQGPRFDPRIELKELDDKCLISISDGFIRMHDSLQEMGWAIAREKDPENPGKWSRLWEYEDIESVLTTNMGTENIEGMFLNMTVVTEPIKLHVEAFKNMNGLRLLKVGPYMVRLSQDFELPFRELTYLEWSGYSLESMPSNFLAYNLVELHLRFSRVKRLWEGNVDARMLKTLDLSHSEQLVDISCISSAPKLEFLLLEGCKRLKSLPRNLHEFKSLQTLSCANCSEIVSFPEFKEIIERLRVVDFSGTGIKEVPSSIRRLHGLETLNLGCCRKLLSLPDSICSLSSLKTLRVENCPKLETILNVELKVGRRSLQHLKLTCLILKSGVIWENNCFSSLEALNPWHDQSKEEILNHMPPLSSLVQLCITNSTSGGIQHGRFKPQSLKISCPSNCHKLEGSIPRDIFHQSSLDNLSLHNFNFKEVGIPFDNWCLPSLRSLCLHYCNLMEGEVLEHVCHLSSLRKLDLKGSHFSSMPAGITRLSNLEVLNLNQCENHQKIPELPLSLRILDARCSNCVPLISPALQFLSLMDWLKSALQFSSKPASIARLNLSALELNHYKNLQQIAVLPSSLRFLDTCGSDCISFSPSSSFSEDSWNSVDDSSFKNPRIIIVLPRSCGILEGISYHRKGSNEVTIKLPPYWYENNNMLGFALYCVYVEPRIGYHWGNRCYFTIKGNHKQEYLGSFLFDPACLDSDMSDFDDSDSDISDIAWILCYPKVALNKYYWSNQWAHFTASFSGGGRVERCGIHLLYVKDYEQMHPSMVQASSNHGNFGDHGSPIKDYYNKAYNKRSLTEQSPGEESQHKRFTGTQR